MADQPVITERTPEAKAAYLDGYEAGIKQAANLARLYEGQDKLPWRIQEAGLGVADVLRKTVMAP